MNTATPCRPAPSSQRKAVAWLWGPGRSNVTAPSPVARRLGPKMEDSVTMSAHAALATLTRLTRLSTGTESEGRRGLAVRWEAALANCE